MNCRLQDPRIEQQGSHLRMAVSFLSSMKEAIVLADPLRRIFWLSPAAEELFGYSLDEVRGQKTQVLYHRPDDYRAQGQERYSRRATPSKASYNVRYRCKSGRVFVSETIGWALHSEEGEVIGYAGLVRDLTRTAALSDVVSKLYAISSNQTMNSVTKIEEIMRLGCDHFKMPTAIVSLISNDCYTVLFGCSTVADIVAGTQFDLKDTYCERTLVSDEPLSFHDALACDFARHPCYRATQLRAYIGVPLIVDGERIGTLNFSSPVAHAPFNEAERDLIKLFAAWVAQELGLEQAYDRLAREASTDWLTKAATRRMFQPELDAAFDDFLVNGHVGSLITFDIDHFKSVNDQYGHAAGDKVLADVVETVRGALPPGVAVYRLGGEEFAVILPDCTAKTAQNLAERLRADIEFRKFEEKAQAFHVTASFGVSTLEPGLKDACSWMKKADAALYRSKQNGRNQVTCDRQVVPLEAIKGVQVT